MIKTPKVSALLLCIRRKKKQLEKVPADHGTVLFRLVLTSKKPPLVSYQPCHRLLIVTQIQALHSPPLSSKYLKRPTSTLGGAPQPAS